jgi:hypothetical protein
MRKNLRNVPPKNGRVIRRARTGAGPALAANVPSVETRPVLLDMQQKIMQKQQQQHKTFWMNSISVTARPLLLHLIFIRSSSIATTE